MKDSKNLVIGMLCAVVCIMAVAYAAFSTTLTINGTATISSNWDVAITNMTCEATEAAGGVEATFAPVSFDTTSATFGFTFHQPGDTGKCVVTITNRGTLAAKVDSISVVDSDTVDSEGKPSDTVIDDNAIKYTVSGITQGTTLGITEGTNTNTYTVNAEYVDINNGQDVSTEQKTKTLTVVINYVQDLSAAA